MEIKYPIFLQDRDKYMYVIESALEINRELEKIDVEENEPGWVERSETQQFIH